jgi:hypothetical protein
MTQSGQPTLIGGIEAAKLREMLLKSDDNTLALFFKSYSLGFAADQFVAAMEIPGERAMFLAAVAKRYPEDWQKALGILAAGK